MVPEFLRTRIILLQETSEDSFPRKHSKIERCLENLELLIQPLDQKLIDYDKEKQHLHEKKDVTKRTERNMMFCGEGRGKIWNFESRISEGQQIIREFGDAHGKRYCAFYHLGKCLHPGARRTYL